MRPHPNPLPNEAVVRQMCRDVQERRRKWADAFGSLRLVGIDGPCRQRAAFVAREAAGDRCCEALKTLVKGEAIGMWVYVYGAGLALVAWPDSVALLDAPVDAVRLMAVAGHHPAVLLLPAAIAKNTKE